MRGQVPLPPGTRPGERPRDVEEARAVLTGAQAAGQTVRIFGGATKIRWGAIGGPSNVRLTTSAMARVLEHNAGDLTAVLEAGVPLSDAQQVFAAEGQMLALDPWLGSNGESTVGGVIATADSGPLRHRYGGARDLVLGMTVVLADGTVARSGGKVIKNVAGYDLAKLFCGSFGTLGLIATVSVRLHPRPDKTVTAVGESREPGELAKAARVLAAAPLELEALDFAWTPGRGTLLARCGGTSAMPRGERVAALMREHGLAAIEIVDDDEGVWERQRARQRSQSGVVVRVASRPSRLGEVLSAVQGTAATVVGRAALGLSFIAIEEEAALGSVLQRLPDGAGWILLDSPDSAKAAFDPWGSGPPAPAVDLMRRVKARFDPAGTCNRGIFVGGI